MGCDSSPAGFPSGLMQRMCHISFQESFEFHLRNVNYCQCVSVCVNGYKHIYKCMYVYTCNVCVSEWAVWKCDSQ